jgi:hypothetical protein
VYSIKSTNGDHRLMWNVLKIRNVMDCFQRNKEIKKAYI